MEKFRESASPKWANTVASSGHYLINFVPQYETYRYLRAEPACTEPTDPWRLSLRMAAWAWAWAVGSGRFRTGRAGPVRSRPARTVREAAVHQQPMISDP
ncbi:hypothetical protein [Streptomyces sp. NPDC059479]|uniref:hypothetical protein n=1 Tax=Streptomyces sp. NPDC059479 TaxID=3346848 RepID=UPI0036B5BB06